MTAQCQAALTVSIAQHCAAMMQSKTELRADDTTEAVSCGCCVPIHVAAASN